MLPQLDIKTTEFLKGTSIFCQPWWLEAVAPGRWDVASVKKGGHVVAVLPYTYKIRLRKFLLIELPPLTPYLGPWLQRSEALRESDRLGSEIELTKDLIDQLPRFDIFDQLCHPSFTNWLPFYWKGFKQTTYYTYVLKGSFNEEQIFQNFTHAKRKNINKAKKIVEVLEDLPSKEFYDSHKLTLQKQGRRINYSFELFDRVYNACAQHKALKIFYAINSRKDLHSAILTVSDPHSAYFLISSIDPDFRESGATTLLLWNALQYYSSRVPRFDFEGSMNEGVARSFREFGATQIPQHRISKTNSHVLKAYRALWRWTHSAP